MTEVISGISSFIAPESEDISFIETKECLNDNLNTKYWESKPVISPDGGKLYFVRRNAPDNKGKKSDDQNIYVSN